MHTVGSKRLLPVAATLLLVSGSRALAGSADAHPATSWLDQAVIEKHCPIFPINVSTEHFSNEELQKQIAISGETLYINGTDDPDYIRVSPGGAPQFVRVAWNGEDLGRFGPVKSIKISGNGGDDVLIVDFDVKLPALIDGGADDDCLQGGSGGGAVLGGPGDDVLIAGTGRPWIAGGPGNDRVVVPRPMGTLRYAPGADSGVLSLLGEIYDLEPVSASPGSSQGMPAPILLGPSDLGDEQLLGPMLRDVAAGQSVVATDATGTQLGNLRLLLNLPTAASQPTSSQSALAFFRRDPRPGTKAYDNYVGYFTSLPQSLDEWTTQLLSQVFSATAIAPNAPGDSQALGDSPTNDLQNLADSYTSSAVNQDGKGNSVQIVNSVWAVRSFQNSTDFYYVLQEADYRLATASDFWVGSSENTITSPTRQPNGLIRTSPASTHCSTSTTSGTSWSIGGSAGWQQAQGLNAVLTGGVSVSNTETISCPAIDITNLSDPSTAKAYWGYVQFPVQRVPNLYVFYNQWIWQVPFSNYQGENVLSFHTDGLESWHPCLTCQPVELRVADNPNIPLPFGQTFALQQPVVLSVNPTCVTPGHEFSINGAGLYPSLVSSVLIGGTPLSPAQYTPVSDTLIRVVAPKQTGNSQPVVVQTGVGLSNSNISIKIQDSCKS
jgi:hypothetical protein